MRAPSAPYLLLKPSIVKQNIARLATKLKKQDIRFQPHFKTHQSLQIAEWFTPYTSSITVSSWEMARYFADQGWDDILLAYPFHLPQASLLREFKASETKVSVLVDHPEQVRMLRCLGKCLKAIYIEIDCGYIRSGIAWQDEQRLADVVDALTSNDMEVSGFYSHFGGQYLTTNEKQRKEFIADEMRKLMSLRNHFGLLTLKIAIGDTPTSSMSILPDHIDSFHAGNFVFYDMQQLSLGACKPNDMALALVTEVISTYPQRGEFLIKTGSVHLSKDFYLDLKGRTSYGLVVRMVGANWDISQPLGWIRLLSQEHSIVCELKAMPRIGEKVAVIPAHSCLCASNFGEYWTSEAQTLSKMKAF